MKILMLFVDGYEDTEAIATLDVLTRGGDEVVCASLMKRKEITPKLGRRSHLPREPQPQLVEGGHCQVRTRTG